MIDRRRRSTVAACFGAMLALSACVSRPHVPWDAEVTLPSEAERAGIRTIGIVAAEILPDDQFTSGQISQSVAAAGGAITGAGQALNLLMESGVLAGLNAEGFAAVVAFPIAGGALLAAIPAGAIIGAAVAESDAVSEETIRAVEQQFSAVLADQHIQDRVGDLTTEYAATETGYLVVRMVDTLSPDQRRAAGLGIDAVLEVDVQAVGMVVGHGRNPPLTLFITVRAQLVREPDGRVLYGHTVGSLGPSLAMSEWGALDRDAVQAELDRAYRNVAERVVEEAFLLWRPDEVAEER